MIDLKDLARPPALLALAGSAAVGFAAGFLLGRDPQVLRRVLAAAAQGWEQARMTVAEAREDLADQWAEATEAARDRTEEAAFAAAPGAAAAAPAGAPEPALAPVAQEVAAAPPVRRAKRSRTTARRVTPRTTH